MGVDVPSEWLTCAEKLEAAGERCKSAAEIFSGAHTWTDEWRKAGFDTDTYDIVDDPELQDATTEAGIQTLVDIVSRVVEKGVVHLAPKCSTYVFVNLSTSGRSRANPEGDLSKPQVVEANAIARTLSQIVQFLCQRGVYYVIEQPRNSIFYHLRDVSEALSCTGAVRLSFNMGEYFGGSSAKPTELWGTAPWLLNLTGIPKLDCAFTVQLARCRDGKVTGNRDLLRRSQVYPHGYGRRMAQLHQSFLASFPVLALWSWRNLPATTRLDIAEYAHGMRAAENATRRIAVAKGLRPMCGIELGPDLADRRSESIQMMAEIHRRALARPPRTEPVTADPRDSHTVEAAGRRTTACNFRNRQTAGRMEAVDRARRTPQRMNHARAAAAVPVGPDLCAFPNVLPDVWRPAPCVSTRRVRLCEVPPQDEGGTDIPCEDDWDEEDELFHLMLMNASLFAR